MYPVDAPEPVHLIEVLLRRLDAPIDLAEFAQPSETQSPDNWQAAYDERILSTDGEHVLWNPWVDSVPDEAWIGDVRMTFFMHYLDERASLTTPFGDVALPVPSPLPERLASIRYEAPG